VDETADETPDASPAERSYRRPVLFYSDLKVSPARAAELRSKLKEIMDSLNDHEAEDRTECR
jgi:hypothetical protein